jgi:hypothetical protein
MQRKVRCTGCGAVILLTPDDDAPDGMTVSIPQQSGKRTNPFESAENRYRLMVYSGAAIALLLIVLGLWWYFSAPTDRGAIEGDVTFDGHPVDKGYVVFVSLNPSTPVSTRADIKDGHYKVAADKGPVIGLNRVEVYAQHGTGRQIAKNDGTGEMVDEYVDLPVHASYNTQSTITVDISRGNNTKDLPVFSRK